jgi:protein SCO1/2
VIAVRWGFLLTIMVLLVVVALWPRPPAVVATVGKPVSSDLPVLGALPDFALTASSGRRIARGDLIGSVWIVDFVFTRCGGPCPAMSKRMSTLQRQIEGTPGVNLLTISVDPRRDTIDTLARYARELKAIPDRWLFLTGEGDAIYRLSKDGFKLSAGVTPAGDPEAALMPFFHSTKFVLLDCEARIRGYYDGTDDAAVGRLVADAHRLATATASATGAARATSPAAATGAPHPGSGRAAPGS